MSISDKIIMGIIFPLFFCSIGYGIFARKGYNLLKTKRKKKLKCLSQTSGHIVGINSMPIKRSSGGYSRCYFPIYEYEVDGEIIRAEYDAGTSHRQFKVGDTVKIWYDSGSPTFSYIDGYREDMAASIGSFVAGWLCVLIGLFVGISVWFN